MQRKNLELFSTPAGRSLRDLLKLFDSLAEVCDPLDDSHGHRNGVSAPATRYNACFTTTDTDNLTSQHSFALHLKNTSSDVLTFDKVIDERAQVVGLLFLALAHLHHIREVLTDVLQHTTAHLHLPLEEPEQRILQNTTALNPRINRLQTLGHGMGVRTYLDVLHCAF